MNWPKSQELLQQNARLIPGGLADIHQTLEASDSALRELAK
jgi:hypothetical protein